MSDIIGFYSLVPSQDAKGYLGALLVTDELGKPEEFRVTYPVKPTLLQKQLYGESMLAHIGIELCGVPLYQALKVKPIVMVVSDSRFLHLGERVSSLIAQVERAGDALKLSTPSSPSLTAQDTLTSASTRFQPLTVVYPADYREEKQRETLSRLGRFFTVLDLLEPFDRIDAATKALAAQDERFR